MRRRGWGGWLWRTGRFAGGGEFAFGLQPVVEIGTGRRAALEENLVGARSDLLFRGKRSSANGFISCRWCLKRGDLTGHAFLQCEPEGSGRVFVKRVNERRKRGAARGTAREYASPAGQPRHVARSHVGLFSWKEEEMRREALQREDEGGMHSCQ